jgi:hypothetical protein
MLLRRLGRLRNGVSGCIWGVVGFVIWVVVMGVWISWCGFERGVSG